MRKPEEFIFAIVGILWVILTFFASKYFNAPTQTAILISALTIIWCFVAFKIWQKAWLGYVWPVFLGLLVMCWWPIFDWQVLTPMGSSESVLLVKPWYATWMFKGIIAALPVVIGYGISWKVHHSKKRTDLYNTTP